MISTKCFDGLPHEYESFLIEKYDSFVTTCQYIEIFHPPTEAHYMLLYENELLQDIYIFDIRGNTAVCLNSLIHLNMSNTTAFKNELFAHYPEVTNIEFPSIYNDIFHDKSIITLRSDNYVIPLPDSMDGYFQQLGSSTRSNVRKHKRKFLNDYPNAKFVAKSGSEIDERMIDKIIRLNFERILSKNEVPHANHDDVNHHYNYSKHYGCVTYIELDGAIIAGCIAYTMHGSMYSYFLSHDNNYSKYNAGQLCMLFLIEVSIEKGFRDFHLLWGECEYKTRFLAKPRPLFSYKVFRSYSSSFFLSRIKEAISYMIYKIKISKFAVPIKNQVKKLRKKSEKELCKLEY